VKEVNEKEKIEIIDMLNKKYKGDFDFLLEYEWFKNSDNKYFIFSGKLLTYGERIGLEAVKLENGKIRANFHFANLFKDKFNDFVLEFDKEQAKKLIKGEDIYDFPLDNLVDKEFYLVKHKDWFIGVVKVNKKENKLINYLAKQYRFKNIEI
jgi:NOL1/NOP2/fmu family ribosome biogenesis protein